MKLDRKVEIVEKIKKIVETNEILLVIHYRGMTDTQLTSFRRSLAKSNSGIYVSKNTLTRLGFAGTPADKISQNLSGPTAIIYSNNLIHIAKIVFAKLADYEDMRYIVGMYKGDVIDVSFISKVSNLGSEQEVMSRFVALLTRPAARLLGVFSAKLEN